jgi:TRAP-type uncharacterized transport system substrate-binding protein
VGIRAHSSLSGPDVRKITLYKPLDIAQLCANDEEAPLDAPLHPGAKRFYREREFLK